MTQYNALNVKLSNSQVNKLKLGIKNSSEVTLKISSNVVSDSYDENNFPHKLLLTNTQVLRHHKALANNSSANIKLSKTQLHKILGRLLRSLLKAGLPLMKNLLKPLANVNSIRFNNNSISNRCSYSEEKLESGVTTLTTLNEEMNDIMKIV